VSTVNAPPPPAAVSTVNAPPPPAAVSTVNAPPPAAALPSVDPLRRELDCEDIDLVMNRVADLYHQNEEGMSGNSCCSLDALLNEDDDLLPTGPATLPMIARLEHMAKFEDVLAKDIDRVTEIVAELQTKKRTPECVLIEGEVAACAAELQQSVVETTALAAAEYQHEIDGIGAMVAGFKAHAVKELQARVDGLGPEEHIARIQSELTSLDEEIRAELCTLQKRVARAMRKKRRMQLRAEAKRIGAEILGLAAMTNTARAELFTELRVEIGQLISDISSAATLAHTLRVELLADVRSELLGLVQEVGRLNADIEAARHESQGLLDKHNLQMLKRSFVEGADLFLPPMMLEDPVCRLCARGISWD
jgi:hypothetical protein